MTNTSRYLQKLPRIASRIDESACIELLGQSTFQAVAIQFVIDQLEGAPSEVLSAFVYW